MQFTLETSLQGLKVGQNGKLLKGKLQRMDRQHLVCLGKALTIMGSTSGLRVHHPVQRALLFKV